MRLLDLFVGIITFLLVMSCKPISLGTNGEEPSDQQLKTNNRVCSSKPSACLFTEQHSYQDDSMHRTMGYLCAAWLSACNPSNNPPPKPIPDAGTGGSISTGGRSSVATGGRVATGGSPSAIGGRPSNTTGGSTSKSSCQALCDHLLAIGCPTQQASCVSQCTLHSTDKRFTQNISCEMTATTVAAAQKCGPASCR